MGEEMTSAGSAVVLFGHGARDPEWARPMERIRAALEQQGVRVELAFLEFMTPPLADAIGRLVAGGADRIAVVPVFLAQGGHLKRDLPLLVEEARGAHPDCAITLARAAGEADGVVSAMADYARHCVQEMRAG